MPVKPMSKCRPNSTNRSGDYRSRWSGSKKVGTFPLKQQRPWIEPNHDELSIVEQCRLAGVSRSGLYYTPVGESAENIALMRLLDDQYMRTPYYGIRRMTWWLETQGRPVNAGSATAPANGIGRDLSQTAVVDAGPGTPDLPVPVAPSTDITYIGKDSSIWWRSWTGSAGTCWPGKCPHRWTAGFACRRWTARIKSERIVRIVRIKSEDRAVIDCTYSGNWSCGRTRVGVGVGVGSGSLSEEWEHLRRSP